MIAARLMKNQEANLKTTENQELPIKSHVDGRVPNSQIDMRDENTQRLDQFSSNEKSLIIVKKISTSGKRKISQIASTTSNRVDNAFIEWIKKKRKW